MVIRGGLPFDSEVAIYKSDYDGMATKRFKTWNICEDVDNLNQNVSRELKDIVLDNSLKVRLSRLPL
ncbi:MAG: hypothetical protein QW794_00885 [Thermosphaera sp.]